MSGRVTDRMCGASAAPNHGLPHRRAHPCGCHADAAPCRTDLAVIAPRTPAEFAASPLSTAAQPAGPLTPAQVNAAPNRYTGQAISVQGTLTAEGQGLAVRFYLVGDDGARLAVEPWLPLEVMQAPKGRAAPPSMATVAGRRMRLRGVLAQRDQTLSLTVSEAAEIP